jgi:hypothetical protein
LYFFAYPETSVISQPVELLFERCYSSLSLGLIKIPITPDMFNPYTPAVFLASLSSRNTTSGFS